LHTSWQCPSTRDFAKLRRYTVKSARLISRCAVSVSVGALALLCASCGGSEPLSIDQYLARRDRVALDEVSLGYRTVRLLSRGELNAAQEGYEGGGWRPEWLVIAEEDDLGDPIFTDLSVDRLPVFTAAHREGDWDPVQIADSFDGFVAALSDIASISARREHPAGLEENPLPDDERERLLDRISDQNPNSDLEFWQTWLEV